MGFCLFKYDRVQYIIFEFILSDILKKIRVKKSIIVMILVLIINDEKITRNYGSKNTVKRKKTNVNINKNSK